ncbi:helix-turn-helix transcriptional regulator [Streptomyces wuyuanensis]|uniref:helix-turn-helix transcriptional regulator n=1 Tax=Streptomyces wuyuanensis TaxID=1196353 RepID=UPI0034213444
MPHASTPVATIAERVRELRGRRGWSAAKLGEELSEHGVSWDRFAVANLEKGKRQTVTVQELLALAFVLDVAPVNLLVPLDDRAYQVTTDRTEDADTVRAWVRGEDPLPGRDERMFFAEVSTRDLRMRVEAVRERYDLGPYPEDEPEWQKFGREGDRMRKQNKRLLDEGEE